MQALLFDPDGSHRSLVEDVVTARGVALEVHVDPESAWKALRSAMPPLVILDGSAQSIELCQRIEDQRLTGGSEVLVLLDEIQLDRLTSFLDAGADDCLLEPIDHRRLSARLRLTEHRVRRQYRFRQLLDIFPDAVAVHCEGSIVYINPVGTRLLGASSPDELIGRRMLDFVAPEFRPLVRRRVRELLRERKPQRKLEEKLVRIDGREIDAEVFTLPTTFRDRPAVQVVIRDITERKRAEDALRESEQRFRSLFDGVPVGAYRISTDGRIADSNRTLVTLLGYSRRDELLGLDPRQLYVDDVDREAWETLMRKDGQVLDFEAEVYRRDRSTIWVRTHTRALRDADGRVAGYDGTAEDITGRKRAEDALRESEDRFRSLVQNTSDMIAVLDPQGEILYLSPSSIRISGYPSHQRVGRPAFEHVHPDDLPEIHRRYRQLIEEPGSQFKVEFRQLHQDGEWRVFESVFSNLLENRAVKGVVVNTRDVSARKEAEEQLLHDALHDTLTSLPNRTLFMDRLGVALGRRGQHCAVLFLDLDRFKMINDSLGHACGDEMLVEAGRRLMGCLRPSDTLARLGGDEFALLLENVRDPSHPVRVARRILRALREPFRLAGREVFTSASIGIGVSQHSATSPAELLRDADTAMYRAKGRGRAGYALFDAAMHAQVLEQLQLETALRRAVDQWQFEVYYQPLVQLETGEVAGVEALVRWRHPEKGLVPPAEFIPMAEETGLINPLGCGVLTQACRQMKTWQERHGNGSWFVHVNLSNRQFASGGLVEEISEALRQSGLPGHCLVLEITESVVMEQPDEIVLAVLRQLKELDVQLSIDDFGTGHSSLSMLHRFPFDKVKLDRWFVGNIGIDRGSDDLVEGVLALCHWRRLVTIAEGVETAVQRERLRELGCAFAQGFLFAHPVDARAAEELLVQRFLVGASV